MRRAILTLAGLAVLAAATVRAENYKAGDKVVVIHNDVEVKVRYDVVDTVGRGQVFVVREVRGEWIEIISDTTGFIEKQHVIPFDQAIGYWSGVIRSNPKDAWAYAARANAWEELKELDKAIKDYGECLRLDPKNGTAHNWRGSVWREKGEYDIAIADYNESIRLYSSLGASDRSQAVPYGNRGSAWVSKREYDKAIADYDEAIRLNPSLVEAYTNRGLAWVHKGDYDKAIVDFDEAIRLEPKFGSAYHGRGFAWKSKQEYDKAIADSNEAIRLEPKFGSAYLNRGFAWKSKQEYDKAIADSNEAIRLDPKNASAYNNWAWFWATCPEARYRDGKKAVESATRACELTEWNDPGKIGTLAAAYAEAGDFDAAVMWQKKSVDLAKDAKKAAFSSRLGIYQQRQAYREEPKK